MLEVLNIYPDSIAADLELQAGDQIVSINGKAINDQLDFRFYSSDEKLDLLIQRQHEQILFGVEKEIDEDLGLELQEMQMKSCGNSCIFCFVYQNPKGMRRPLYFKDEDFRFSFLYGHYVTLTTVTDQELARIVEQQLTPLYISVHATDTQTRRLLLGLKKEDYLFDKIKYLVDGGIELHTQIVLCPGINDGPIFDRTVTDLQQFYPGVKSIAVVPVGLTRHRKNLYPLRIYTRSELQEMISYMKNIRTVKQQELGSTFVYLSDEFFIRAGQPLPERAYYDEFYQIENGVGEFRDMIDTFNAALIYFPEALPSPVKITWITGELAAGPLKAHIISRLRRIRNLDIQLVPVKNHFYGEAITVSGLLVGQDIFNQLYGQANGDLVLLPPRVLNHNGLFLDDWNVDRLQTKLSVPCHVFTEPLGDLFNVIRKYSKR